MQSTPISSIPSHRSTLATPEPTFSVSISTPHSNAPSIASQLETVPSIRSDLTGPPPGEIITHDVNRLLQYLHEVDSVRNGQNVDMAKHLDRIELSLRNLAVSLKEKCDKPPPVPTKDISIGRSTRTPTPVPPPEPSPTASAPGLSVRSLSPPPERLPSPSSLLTSISWLSSHHSDDWEVMSSEEVKLLPPEISSTSPATITPISPSVSPSPSVDTVRPSLTLGDLRGMIDVVLSEVANLREAQFRTQDMLKDIRRETTGENLSETSEQRQCKVMIKNTEGMLKTILEKLTSEARTSISLSDYTSEGEDQAGLIDLFTRLLRPAPPPTSLPIHAPSPVPPLPPMSDLFPEVSMPSAPTYPIHLEPLPTIQRPRMRNRPRSISPPIISFRPATAPVPSSDGVYRDIPPFVPPAPSITDVSPILRSTRTLRDIPPRTERPLPARPLSTDLPDMERAVRDHREARRHDAPNGFFIPAERPSQQPVVYVLTLVIFVILTFHAASAP